MHLIDNVLQPRCPPHLIAFVSCSGTVFSVFCNNVEATCVFVIFAFFVALLNVFFETFTVTMDYTNDNMPNYNDLSLMNNYCITNKKYVLITKNVSICPPPFEIAQFVDDSKLMVEISIYVGKNKTMNNVLNVIYLLGITPRNYTTLHHLRFMKNNVVFC